MSLSKLIVSLACLSSGAIAVAQAPASPAKDPRIGQIVKQLEAVRAPRQTAIAPDGKSVAWVVRAQEGRGTEIVVAPLDNPSSTYQITACPEGKQGEENEIAWSP